MKWIEVEMDDRVMALLKVAGLVEEREDHWYLTEAGDKAIADFCAERLADEHV